MSPELSPASPGEVESRSNQSNRPKKSSSGRSNQGAKVNYWHCGRCQNGYAYHMLFRYYRIVNSPVLPMVLPEVVAMHTLTNSLSVLTWETSTESPHHLIQKSSFLKLYLMSLLSISTRRYLQQRIFLLYRVLCDNPRSQALTAEQKRKPTSTKLQR